MMNPSPEFLFYFSGSSLKSLGQLSEQDICVRMYDYYLSVCGSFFCKYALFFLNCKYPPLVGVVWSTLCSNNGTYLAELGDLEV